MAEGEQEYLQVLLLVAHKERAEGDTARTEEAGPGTQPPLFRSKIVLYALLPRIDRFDALAKVFGQNGVIVLRTDELLSPFLLEAARSERLELVEMVVRVGHHIVDSSGRLIVTVDPSNSDLLPVLLVRYIVDETTRWRTEDDALSLLYHVLVRHSLLYEANLQILTRLLTAGPNLKLRHKDGGTLLHYAVRRKYTRLVAILVESGANLEARRVDGKTPLLLAIDTYPFYVSQDILTRLLESGANVNAEDAKGATPFLVALQRQQSTDRIRILIDNGADVNANTQFGSALKLAAGAGSDCLSMLLNKGGLDIDKHRDMFKEILMCSTTDKCSVRKLFDYGFKLLPEDAKNIKILDGVLKLGDRQIFEDLLRWGAVVHLKPRPNRTVPDAAPKDVMKELLILALSREDNKTIKYLFEIDDVREAEFFSDILREAIKTFNTGCFRTVLKVGNPGLSCLFVKNVLDELEPVELEPVVMEYYDYDDFIDVNIEANYENSAQNNVRHEMKKALSRHIVMLASADLVVNKDTIVSTNVFGSVRLRKDQLPEWVLKLVPSTFLEECVNEVTLLKTESVGDSTITYYDVLNATMPQIIRFLKNKSIRCTLKSKSYFAQFPLYSPIIYHRFRNCNYKVTLMKKAMQMFGHLCEFSKNIPFELRELIMQPLCNHELLILINVCNEVKP
nr:PREDICTED: uncharacterized protein LOC109035712 isoform X1 [Bemisia tabaci]